MTILSRHLVCSLTDKMVSPLPNMAAGKNESKVGPVIEKPKGIAPIEEEAKELDSKPKVEAPGGEVKEEGGGAKQEPEKEVELPPRDEVQLKDSKLMQAIAPGKALAESNVPQKEM